MHDIVAGGGRSAEGAWLPSRHNVLVHVTPLSLLFRAKCRDALQQTDLFPLVDAPVWTKDWVVHCEPVGSGEEAFRSLAPYIFRVALRNNRVLTLEDGHGTFQYTESAPDQPRATTVPAQEFIRRFLQHVLPDRFINVRYDGFLSPGNRHRLTRVSTSRGANTVDPPTTGQQPAVKESPNARDAPRCPTCGNISIRVETRRPTTRSPP